MLPCRGPWVFFLNGQNKEVAGGALGYACKYAAMRIWYNRPYTHRCVYGIKWVNMYYHRFVLKFSAFTIFLIADIVLVVCSSLQIGLVDELY